MAENGENAIKFVNELLDKIKAPFFREMETLRSLKARLTGQENARLNPWDVAYYAKQKERARAERLKKNISGWTRKNCAATFPFPACWTACFPWRSGCTASA